MHHIKTDIFEGPLELLLDLIEKQKLSINHVSLAAIADTYILEIKSRAVLLPGEVADFLVVASTLMLIKSRSLLPNMPISEEEEASIRNLEDRLFKLRRIRELSRHIAEHAHRGARMYGRAYASDLPSLFYPPKEATPRSLHAGIRALIDALPYFIKKSRLPEKALQSIVSIEEKIRELMERVEQSLTHSFQSFVSSTKGKTEIIVSFLALLELVKQGSILVEQGKEFGDIIIKKN